MNKRMRTLEQAIKEIRAADPNTSITPYALKTAVLRGIVPHVLCGRKRLIDVDTVVDYLYANSTATPQATPAPGHTRPITE